MIGPQVLSLKKKKKKALKQENKSFPSYDKD